ncbi:MAG: c-type cytochrome [Chloroflexi bacterium]|nr:c-type cytochrome [Chloroflexota bacterium]MCL5273268.1 c-type cytochrome [Chloroflexota bacterium]
MSTHHRIRTIASGALIGIPMLMLVFGFAKLSAPRVHHLDLHGVVAEAGGWSPASFKVGVGDLVQIHLTSGDVLHGFAIGQTDFPAGDVVPGKISELDVTFDHPGKYVFYCTRWCGPGHWRMRGTIEVVAAGSRSQEVVSSVPLYGQLGLDIDAAHPATVVPARRPSAAHGASLGVSVPAEYLAPDTYRAHSPAQVWQTLRALPVTAKLSDAAVWDVVATIWESNTSAQALATGKQLYTANCAACHGDSGAGDGPMAAALGNKSSSEFGSGTLTPANFTAPATMLGASPALLQGKIIRGGMGTGMPYWGPVFSDSQVWAIIDYLWTFQMAYQSKP